ncbi:hypothetical protein CANTEDRAFT_134153 [Yamadazyma tenuis ATCC 10573]|uniref:Inner kinetochore subunit AME1 domain-containing protein n=2 Tax=Candida tenuis TaxID=2315449 RepID=G3B0Z9_CANTC|nr:uncharacterized protein CANTEDRAFT_134153 [Yamadazyma tenuis ATCC 10573]EGV64848.1 hypothetical protein CANTEDRAFT_134153 [Yamadazyma tenuis ATCC 10573]
MLESALNEDTHLPKLRSESHKISPGTFYKPPHQIPSAPENFDQNNSELPRSTSATPSVDVDGGSDPGDVSPVVRKRGRPKKQKTPSVEPEAPKRPRGRPRKGTSNPVDTTVDLSDGSIATRRQRRRTAQIGESVASMSSLSRVRKPVPLTKQAQAGKSVQRPLNIDIDRLIVDINRDKRLKVNVLDVLKHLVKTFETPDFPTDLKNPKVIQNDFKTHLLDYLNHLADVHGSIHDLVHEINRVRKEKEEMRRNIFEIRRSYADVMNDLNKTRSQFSDSKRKYDSFISLTRELDELRSQATSSSSSGNHISSIDREITILDQLFNPINGLQVTLSQTNETLEHIDRGLN